ncbi:hypothetical protein [Helicobacter sp. T3_23-1056]
MLIYNEIKELKTLNEHLKGELESIKQDTKTQIQNETKDLVKNELDSALDTAKSHINAYADEKIAQSTSDLESYHAREVKKMFEARIYEILNSFSIDSLSQKIAYEFANQNANNAQNALESLILKHTSDFIKAAKSDIAHALSEALDSSREILESARELKNELISSVGLNAIRKYRFEASLHLSAMSAQSNLKILANTITELSTEGKFSSVSDISQEVDSSEQIPLDRITHNAFATK